MKKFQITFEIILDGDYSDNPTDLWDMEEAIKETSRCITEVNTLSWSEINKKEQSIRLLSSL